MFICGSLFGCRVEQPQAVGYFGPIDPMAKVIADVNANNQKVSTISASGHFDAWLNGRKNYLNGTISMAYASPNKLLIRANKDIIGTVLELGTNDERFWMIERSGQGVMYTGTYKNFDKVNTSEIPIRPDLVLQVLGVQPIPERFLEQPVPIQRFNPDQDVYMIDWNVQLADRWIAQKEVWYDRVTKLPRHVLLYDQNGRVLLSAWLADHEPIRTDDVPQQQWPKVATAYHLFFPDTQTTIDFTLKDELAAKRNGAPNSRSFNYPDPQRVNVGSVVDFDAQTKQ